ncbi:MAG: amidohydrolase family protein [Rhodospirillales bacterium]|nr:amidohydrolase family protein [Rhodospirillales bacterium]
MPDLTVTNVRPFNGTATDIHIRDGIVVDAPGANATVVDGLGAIALPAFVDAHMHLDKTLWGLPWRAHSAGKRLDEKIANERAARQELGADVEIQAARLIDQAIKNGTAAIRSHVDIDPDIGLANVESLLRVKSAYADVVDIQLVAFPQTGLVSRPGTSDLMHAAIEMGVDLVGGIDPQAIDGDADAHVRTIFDLAERTGAGIDIHHHEEGDAGADTLDLILDAVEAYAMQGCVTLSHAFCIGMVSEARMQSILDRIATLDVAIITTAPGYKAFPPVQAMREREIRVASGSDGVRDVWTPFGNADMLERAMLLAYRSNFRRDDEIEMVLDICTYGGGEVMDLEDHGPFPGQRADIVLIEAENAAEAVVNRPSGRRLIKNGALIG